MIEVSAKNIAMSPRKVGLVVGLVRRRSCDEALEIIAHTHRRAARPVEKLLKSGRQIAQKQKLEPSSVLIDEIFVTPGPRFKRHRPKARGRSNPYQKKSCHIYLRLSGQARPTKRTTSQATKQTTNKESHGSKS